MEDLIKQRRARFSDPRQAESNRTRERTPPQQKESFKGDKKVQNWFRRQFSGQMNQDYDSREMDFATAIAAAAFAIHSLEETEAQYQKKMREEFKASRTRIKSRKEDTTAELPKSGRVTRRFPNKEAKIGGDTSLRYAMAQDRKAPESVFPNSKPRHYDIGAKADAWEKSELEKIKKRHEKMKSTILGWENEKKMKAKIKIERKKAELEQRRTLNLQHYQNKIARIDHIAGGARAQAEQKRRSEESEVKEKAKKIRSTGRVPVNCFCF